MKNFLARALRRALVLCSGAVAVAGCDTVTSSSASYIQFEPEVAELTIGDTLWVQARVHDARGRVTRASGIVWRPVLGAVIDRRPDDSDGWARLLARWPGTHQVVVEWGGHVDSMQVTVHGHPNLRLTTIDVGTFACGIADGGGTYCWGSGQYVGPTPNLPDGAHMPAFGAPRRVRGDVALQSVVVAAQTACGLAADGQAYCWGNAQSGSLGQPGLHSAAEPLPVAGGSRYALIAGGGHHVCGLTDSGDAYCWGSDRYGQLGIPEDAGNCSMVSPCSDVPAHVAADVSFASLHAGGFHTCGLTAHGAAYCWGLDNHHQLGTTLEPDHCDDMFGLYHCSRTPVPVEGAPPFVQLALGLHHSCGLTVAGRAYCWGRNDMGQLGTGVPGDATPTPQPVDTPVLFTSLWSGTGTTCGIAADGAAYCWGESGLGQAGSEPLMRCPSNNQGCTPRPEAVVGNLRFSRIAIRAASACGLAEDGVYCWGSIWGMARDDGEPWPVTDRATPYRVYGTR
ncbi:MAG TPA: hypothetical protein VK929_09275 [Longimicrobiales bacterium]|nr:hypothetical protein [Longimicrobiales bacterium]